MPNELRTLAEPYPKIARLGVHEDRVGLNHMQTVRGALPDGGKAPEEGTLTYVLEPLNWSAPLICPATSLPTDKL